MSRQLVGYGYLIEICLDNMITKSGVNELEVMEVVQYSYFKALDGYNIVVGTIQDTCNELGLILSLGGLRDYGGVLATRKLGSDNYWSKQKIRYWNTKNNATEERDAKMPPYNPQMKKALKEEVMKKLYDLGREGGVDEIEIDLSDCYKECGEATRLLEFLGEPKVRVSRVYIEKRGESEENKKRRKRLLSGVVEYNWIEKERRNDIHTRT